MESGLEENLYKYMYPMGYTLLVLWTSKIHKTCTPLRPIVSNSG